MSRYLYDLWSKNESRWRWTNKWINVNNQTPIVCHHKLFFTFYFKLKITLLPPAPTSAPHFVCITSLACQAGCPSHFWPGGSGLERHFKTVHQSPRSNLWRRLQISPQLVSRGGWDFTWPARHCGSRFCEILKRGTWNLSEAWARF